jgi:hypothetical protein
MLEPIAKVVKQHVIKQKNLDATGFLAPVGVITDNITSRRRTG